MGALKCCKTYGVSASAWPEKAQVDIEDDDGHSHFGRLLYALDGEIADIVPQTLDECRLHAWLLVHEWCSEATGCSRDAIDTRLAKSLLAALERLAREG